MIFNGVRVRLRAYNQDRARNNLRILATGIESMKRRLADGVGSDDQRLAPLTKNYAKYKSRVTGRRAVRDMRLTGSLLDGIKPRYADDSMAIADASGRRARMGKIKAGITDRVKARIHKRHLIFSPKDQEAMSREAAEVFQSHVAAVVGSLSPKGGGALRVRLRGGGDPFKRREV
jgi:hypothetical protein